MRAESRLPAPRRAAGALVLVVAAGCPKGGESPSAAAGAGGLELSLTTRTPVQCSRLRKEEQDAAEAKDAGGCNASVQFRLAPSGEVDLDMPNFRDATRAETRRMVDANSVIDRQLVLRDVAGENLWKVAVPEDKLPWEESGRCARPADAAARARFDLSVWRVVVVQIRTRDPYGSLLPYVEGRSGSLGLEVTGKGGAKVQATSVASTTHDGVWAAVWCDRVEGPLEFTLDVRGAYQLERDTFSIPDVTNDTYTLLEYIVEPTKG